MYKKEKKNQYDENNERNLVENKTLYIFMAGCIKTGILLLYRILQYTWLKAYRISITINVEYIEKGKYSIVI